MVEVAAEADERSRGNRETQRSRRGHHVPRCEHAGRQRAAARRGAGQAQVPAVRHLRHGIQRARGEGLRGQRGRLPGQAGRDRASRAGDQQGPKQSSRRRDAPRQTSASPWRRAARSCSSPPARFTTSWPRTTTPTSTRSTDRYLSTVSLAQLEAKLEPLGFFRVHRRYLVNLSCVNEVDPVSGGTLLLTLSGEEEQIPVSRRRVAALKKALGI